MKYKIGVFGSAADELPALAQKISKPGPGEIIFDDASV
jgi:hypothetical protein